MARLSTAWRCSWSWDLVVSMGACGGDMASCPRGAEQFTEFGRGWWKDHRRCRTRNHTCGNPGPLFGTPSSCAWLFPSRYRQLECGRFARRPVRKGHCEVLELHCTLRAVGGASHSPCACRWGLLMMSLTPVSSKVGWLSCILYTKTFS